MNIFAKLKARFAGKAEPENLRLGRLGEAAARKFLQKLGLKFLAANFRSERGEIDLVFRDESQKGLAKIFLKPGIDCLVFVEVKARKRGGWTRPAAAVDARKKLRLTRCAFDYLRLLRNPPIKIRFDVVEVLMEDAVVVEVRHLPNTFTLTPPFRYG